jgi:hypothetical protein
MRLFEKNVDGLLVEVPWKQVAAKKQGRRVSSVSFVAEVLWTAEEEAVRDAEEAAAQLAASERQRTAEVQTKERAAQRAAIQAKLGLTDEEISYLQAAVADKEG